MASNEELKRRLPPYMKTYGITHEQIAMVAVVGVPDERMGEIGKAFVVLRPDAETSEADLIAWSRENMANYKVPRSFAFVDELPRNASGKVLKIELK